MNKKTLIYLLIIITIILLIFLSIKCTLEATAISKLQATIKSVQIQEIKVTYTKLKLNIELLNPTNEDISELSTDFNIFITGNNVGKGNTSAINIPAKTIKQTSSIIIIYFADVANAVMDSIINLKFNLTINGTFHAKILFGFFSVTQDFSAGYIYS